MQVRNSLLVFCVLVFAACQNKRLEHAAAGQPSMHDLAQRRNVERVQRMETIRERAKSLTDEQARTLFAELKTRPDDRDREATLYQHYQLAGDTASLNALNLWYIEHQPDGPVWIGNIDPGLDRKGYERGRALWLANLKRPQATPMTFVRAAQFFRDKDRPLSEAVLRAGMKAYPNQSDWTRELGMLYAQGPMRERVAESNDAPLLVATAKSSMRMGDLEAAREYIARAERLDGDFTAKSGVAAEFKNAKTGERLRTLMKLSPAEKAKLPESDELLLTFVAMQNAWYAQKVDEAEVQARKATALAGRLPSDPMHDVVNFEGNITLGKVSFRRGQSAEAARYLHLAADAPPDGLRWTGAGSLSLTRALIDAGYRTEAADYLDRIATKNKRPEEYRAWASQIRKGINPVDMPVVSSMGCAHDPC